MGTSSVAGPLDALTTACSVPGFVTTPTTGSARHGGAGRPAPQRRVLQRSFRQPLDAAVIGENVAHGRTIEEIQDVLTASKHYRANLLDPRWTVVGIATVRG